jgi:serine/threonine-protein kinase
MPGTGKWLISIGGGQFPIWSRDGRQLFYEGLDDRIMGVAYSAKDDSFAAGKPRPWSSTQIMDIAPHAWNLDLASDGKRFVVAIPPPAESLAAAKNSFHVTFLLNFFDEVRRRIPTRK